MKINNFVMSCICFCWSFERRNIMSKKMMRNPIGRNIENPAGNIMKELSEAELDKVTGGKDIDYKSNLGSCGFFCTITGECQGSAK